MKESLGRITDWAKKNPALAILAVGGVALLAWWTISHTTATASTDTTTPAADTTGIGGTSGGTSPVDLSSLTDNSLPTFSGGSGASGSEASGMDTTDQGTGAAGPSWDLGAGADTITDSINVAALIDKVSVNGVPITKENVSDLFPGVDVFPLTAPKKKATDSGGPGAETGKSGGSILDSIMNTIKSWAASAQSSGGKGLNSMVQQFSSGIGQTNNSINPQSTGGYQKSPTNNSINPTNNSINTPQYNNSVRGVVTTTTVNPAMGALLKVLK